MTLVVEATTQMINHEFCHDRLQMIRGLGMKAFLLFILLMIDDVTLKRIRFCQTQEIGL